MSDPNILAHQTDQEIAQLRFECEHSGEDWRTVLVREQAQTIERLADLEANPPADDDRPGQALVEIFRARIERIAAELNNLDAVV